MNVGSALEIKIHRKVVEDLATLQSREVPKVGDDIASWRNGTW